MPNKDFKNSYNKLNIIDNKNVDIFSSNRFGSITELDFVKIKQDGISQSVFARLRLWARTPAI